MAVGAAVQLIAPTCATRRSIRRWWWWTTPALCHSRPCRPHRRRGSPGATGGSGAGAEPVTTASRAHGLPAADMLGREFSWRVENPQELKALAAAAGER
ncbi:MAG: hypothetical protein U0531_05875 [Dehalococcoidia bacterium]